MTRSSARPHRSRAGSTVGLALVLVLGASMAPVSAANPVPATARAEDYGMGVSIEPGPWTSTPDVILRVLPPPADESVLRISNDRSSWVEVPYAPTIPWSLIDPAVGGVDADGLKLVHVWYGTGGEDWRYYAQREVTLDRVAPSAGDITGVSIDGRMWQGSVLRLDGSAMADVAETRYSIDGGTTWQPWATGNAIDVWNAPGAAAWVAGARSILVQVRDAAGNLSDPIATTAVVNAPEFGVPAYEWNLPGVTIDTPMPAITGQPFTIRINYPDGYTLPSNAWCHWIMTWGDDDSILTAPPNPTWGELFIERPKANGACREWTFTMPYRAARQFAVQIMVATKNANTQPMELVGSILEVPFQVFRSLDGPHEERFQSSSIPFAYVLPETTVSQAGDPVTYRLHTVGTDTVPQTGQWWTHPLECWLNPSWSQDGGSTFTYRPNCNGGWVTGWTGVMHKGYMRSQYDPLVDGRAPKVGDPVARLQPGSLGARVPGLVRWTGRDGGSGVRRYVVEQRRNGGPWRTLELSSPLAKSVSRSFVLGDTYRFRVKARDRVGNWSGWATGPLVRARVRQESSTAVTWTGPWTTVTGSELSGGAARATMSADATARIRISARGIAWVARRGPDRGLAQVWVDGVLEATVDLGASSLGGRSVVFARSWATAGTHSIRIVPLGTLGRPLVEVDGFVVVD